MPCADAGGPWMAHPVPSPCLVVWDLGLSGATDPPAAGEHGCPCMFFPGAATLCADPCWGPRVSVLTEEVHSAPAPRSGRLRSSLWPCRCGPAVDLAPLWRQVPGWAREAPASGPCLLCSPLLLVLLTFVFGNSCRFAESAEGSVPRFSSPIAASHSHAFRSRPQNQALSAPPAGPLSWAPPSPPHTCWSLFRGCAGL